MKLAFKYRFYPTPEQAQELAHTFGCVRYVYNFGLTLRQRAYEERGQSLRYKDTSAALTELKKQEETCWLRDVSSVSLQQTLRHLDKAFTGFFEKRGGYPNFKRKHGRQSAEYTRSAFTYDIGEEGIPVLQLAKMQAPIRVIWSRMPPCAPSTVTVSKDPAGRYFVSLLCQVEEQPLPPKTKAVGIDLGLTNFAVTSDGEKIDNPKFLEADLRRLGHEQRNLSRKVQGSSNWQKQKRRVARIHARIVDKRRDFLHKLSTRLIQENQTICLETLNVKGMMQNGRLARHIGQAGWSEFVRQLEYKAQLYRREVVHIDLWFPSSKQCSSCKHQVKELPLSVRYWTCEQCGTRHGRDTNAAVNILAAGQAVSACGENVRPALALASAGGLGEAGILALEGGEDVKVILFW